MDSSNEQKSDKESWLSKNIIFVLVSLFVIALLSGSVVIYYYSHYFTGDISMEHERWGTMGDFFSGTLNPIFGFIGLFALLLTIAIQNKELSNSTKELRTSARALREQSSSLKIQNFENTFFQLLGLHNKIVGDMFVGEPDSADKGLNGRDCFKDMYNNFDTYFYSRVNQHAEDPNNYLAIIEEAYDEFFKARQADIGHYFRNLYTIVKFVDNSKIDNKKEYVNILRAQLSSYELSMLFYNCLWSGGRKKFKVLIEKYELLENMNIGLLTNSKDQLPLYEKGAYGDVELPRN